VATTILFLVAISFSQTVLAQGVRHSLRRVMPRIPAVSTPEEQGMDSAAFAAGIDFLLENRDTYRVHSVVVIRNDRVVLDARFYPFSSEWRHDLASVTKSLTSTLVGIAIDKGFIAGVDVPVLDYFPDHTIANRDARKERMTLEDLLTMRSGFECDPTNSEATLTEMTNSADWVQFALDLPMADEPGQLHVYCSPNVHLLSAIIGRATGSSTLEFARKHLFGPLGITNVEWFVDPQGIHRGWGDLHLTPPDMPKLGLLFLNRGKWRGRQIVSSEWVEESTAGAGHSVPGWPAGEGYAYLWYYEPSLFNAAGRGGQRIHVYPDENLVIGLNAGSGYGDYYQITLEFLEDWVLGAIESDDPLPPNPGGVAQLASRVSQAAASNEGPPQAVPTLPAIAQSVSGQIYSLGANIYGLSSMRLTCPGGDTATLEISMPEMAGGPMITLQIGLDDVSRFSPGRHGVMTASKGGWVSDNQFSATMDELGLINLWQWDLTFEGDTVTLSLVSLAGGELPTTVTGSLAR
jgi:CubicO group peptidase (beta-lactamase class C family)